MTERPFSHDLSADGRELTLHGELDEGASVVLRELLAMHSEPPADLRVVLSDVDFVPSAAVGVLASSQAAALRAGGSMTLVAADGTIAQRVLTLCSLDHVDA